MKVTRGVVFLLILLTAVFAINEAAIAGRGCARGCGRGCTTGDGIDFNDLLGIEGFTAGTEYSGPLTIYYEHTGVENVKNMYFFLRLEVDNELLSFAGHAEQVPYGENLPLVTLEQAITSQKKAVENFFQTVVNPYIYGLTHPEDANGCEPLASQNMCPQMALTGVEKVVEDTLGPPSGGLYYTIMNVSIGVQE